MKNLSFSALERYIYDVLLKEHLPNQELIDKTEDVLFKDLLCDAIEDLRSQGKIKSYKKDKVTYHFTCN